MTTWQEVKKWVKKDPTVSTSPPLTSSDLSELTKQLRGSFASQFYGMGLANALGSPWETNAPTVVPTEQRTTEVLAWRAWNLVETAEGFRLVSVTRNVVWDGPVIVADAKPELDNATGIYAMKGEAAHRYVSISSMWGAGVTSEEYPVIGSVALYGRVIEGTAGYRGERGVIRSLSLNLFTGGEQVQASAFIVAQDLADCYQVDVTITPGTSTLPARYLTR